MLVEHRAAAILRHALAVVADKTLHGVILARHARSDDDLPARRVGDRVRDQVLKHTPQQTGIGVDDEIVGNLVDQLRRVGHGDWVEIMNEGFN